MSISSSSRLWSVVVIGLILLSIVIYLILMFEWYKSRSFIFAKYTPPLPSTPYFYPLGQITPLTQEEIDQRNAIITGST